MIKPILFSAIVVIITYFGYIIYIEEYKQCASTHLKDYELVHGEEICIDPEKRYKYRNDVKCEEAEKRLQRSVPNCAFYNWSTTVVSRVLDSYILIGCVLVLLMFYMWLWSNRVAQKYAIKEVTRLLPYK